jgi:hypothetical protein
MRNQLITGTGMMISKQVLAAQVEIVRSFVVQKQTA